MRYTLALAALAATTAFAAPAAAQTVPVSATAEARGLIIQPLSFVNLNRLNFGTIVASNLAGSVTIDPATGARTTSGGVTGAPSDVGGRGLFEGLGFAGQAVQISSSVPAMLVNQSDSTQAVVFRNFTLDGANTRVIGVTGSFRVGVGATIDVAANQAPGVYSAQFTVTADYQ